MLFKNLETERLLLKNISTEDREFIFDHFSHPKVTEYLYDEEPLSDISGADEIINVYLEPEPRTQHRWILVTKDGEKIGTCGFHCWYMRQGICDVGYDLRPEYEGKGYMREALETIIQFAFEEMNIKKIKACIYVNNDRSGNLAQRLGFKFSGETENCLFREKEYLHNIYSLENSKVSE